MSFKYNLVGYSNLKENKNDSHVLSYTTILIYNW